MDLTIPAPTGDAEPGQLTALVLADMDDLQWDGPTGKADLLISCGDISDSLILEAAEAYQCGTILAVKGNHDTAVPFAEGIADLHLNHVTFQGLNFAGLNGCWKYKPRGHFLYEQSEVETVLKDFSSCDVFVSHNSPLVHQRNADFHRGFDALDRYIGRTRPRLLLHGHQHIRRETRIRETLVRGVYRAELVRLPRPVL